MKRQTNLSWTVVIIVLILFWPVGLVLLFSKLSNDRSTIGANTRPLKIVGWILIVFGVVYFLGSQGSTSASYSLPAGAALTIGGILILRKSVKMKKEGDLYKKYIDIIINHKERAIDNIVPVVGKDYNSVKADLQKMIDRGYFTGAYINEGMREIVLAAPVAPIPAPTLSGAMPSNTSVASVVQCKGCGANNSVVAGHMNECEYCGSPLN